MLQRSVEPAAQSGRSLQVIKSRITNRAMAESALAILSKEKVGGHYAARGRYPRPPGKDTTRAASRKTVVRRSLSLPILRSSELMDLPDDLVGDAGIESRSIELGMAETPGRTILLAV